MTEQTTHNLDLRNMNPSEFGVLADNHRRELRAHCYRMLGSVHEADEMVQETLWRAWDRRESYRGQASIRAWLYRIATNLSIDALRQRTRRGLPITREAASNLEQPIPNSINEPVWLEPFPFDIPGPEDHNPEAKYSASESIQLAFLASLHLLPPRQRAVLILRDVLNWHADEVASALGQSVSSIKSALHRARTTLARHRQQLQHGQIFEHIPDEALQRRLECYVHAWETADIDGLVALLKDECTFSMPPIPSWYSGRKTIGGLVAKTIFSADGSGRWRLIATRANGQPGFGLYRKNEDGATYDGYGIQVVTLDGELIADITTFRDPKLLGVFRLPGRLTV